MSGSNKEIEGDILSIFRNLVNDAIDYLKTGYRSNPDRKSFNKTSLGTDRLKTEKASDYLSNKLSDEKRKTIVNKLEDTIQEKARKLREISDEIANCKKCSLYLKRLNPVAGEGNPDADIMFIGEGPGEMEDIKGKPFVGRAGKLLTKMLSAINLTREEVFITNVVKCRPPGNRTPLPNEVNTCFPYLERQIEVVQPMIICCLGGPAIKSILGVSQGISKLRGNIYRYKDIPVIPTYHPAAVLRFPDKYRRPVWNDLKMLRDLYKDLKSET